MKIAHLSTSTTGGAAVTAKSIARIQNTFGHDSQVFTRDKNLSPAVLASSRFSTFISLANATKEYAQVTHFSTLGLELNAVWDFKPDVIFIHNWFNLLREKDIASITRRTPTIFLAHDARLATGGCHVTLGCQNFKTGCHHCPAAKVDFFASAAKKTLESMVEQMGEYAFVTPSQWLMNEMTGSAIIANSTISKVIGNPSEAFPGDEDSEMRQSGEPFKIIFVAASLDSAYKGFDLLMESMSLIGDSKDLPREIELKVVGTGTNRSLSKLSSRVNISFLGPQSSSDVHQLIRESDLLIVPSLSENYPGVIGEAQLLGCAVAASNVGGIPEMIEDGVSGFLFEPVAQACKMAILRAINSSSLSQIKKFARERALFRYDEKSINNEYENVIKELKNS